MIDSLRNFSTPTIFQIFSQRKNTTYNVIASIAFIAFLMMNRERIAILLKERVKIIQEWKKSITYIYKIAIQPKNVFLSNHLGMTIVHEICMNGTYEAFKHIDEQLLAGGYVLNASWLRLLSQKDSLNNCTPIEYLSLKNESLEALKEIKKRLNKDDFEKLLFDSKLIFLSLCYGNFSIASYLIFEIPKIINKKTEFNETVWHYLATPTNNIKRFFKTERADFFKKYYYLFQADQLDIIDDNGSTALSIASSFNMVDLMEAFKNAKPSWSIDQKIYSSKLLAQCWSIKGKLSHPLGGYELEGWRSTSFAFKAIFKALKTSLSSQVTPDLLEVLSILTLPLETQQTTMMERFCEKKIWIFPIRLNDHAITLIGSSKLVLICNHASYILVSSYSTQKVPARIHPLIPHEFSQESIFEIVNHVYPHEYALLKDLLNQYKFQNLPYHTIRAQRTGNCLYESSVGVLLGYEVLAKLEKIKYITTESIEEALKEAQPFYTTCKSAIKWEIFQTHKDNADKQLVAAIESKALVHFARKIANSLFKSIQELANEDTSLFPLKAWDSLTEEQQKFFVELSQTKERHKFLQKLFSLKNKLFNQYLTNYVHAKDLKTLNFLIEGAEESKSSA